MRARSHLLAKLSPVLGAAVGLEAGDSFSATLTPLQMHLPAEAYSLRLEPLKLVLATRGLLSGVIALLKWAFSYPGTLKPPKAGSAIPMSLCNRRVHGRRWGLPVLANLHLEVVQGRGRGLIFRKRV